MPSHVRKAGAVAQILHRKERRTLKGLGIQHLEAQTLTKEEKQKEAEEGRAG